MQTRHKQNGMGSITLLAVISIAGFFLLCFFKIGPVYLDNYMLRGAIQSIGEAHPDLHSMSKGQIKGAIGKFLTINTISDEAAENFEVVKKSGKTLINNKYEVKVHLLANIHVVMDFANQYDSSNPGECCEYLVPDEKKANQ